MTALLVANDGGHLMQLFTLAPRLPIDDGRVWLTVPTPQTRSLLAGERVEWMLPAPTRDVGAMLRNAARAAHVLRRYRPTSVVSTGASLAMSVMPIARAMRVRCHYIESATRVHGPSLTGRSLGRLPGIRTYTQHQAWADKKWTYRGSVLDAYVRPPVVPHVDEPIRSPRSVVVSLGTSESFGFRRLLDKVVEVLPPEADVMWQTGSTDVSGLPIRARPMVPAEELFSAMKHADLVIAHAGTGSALAALQAGKLPLLVPRRPERGEHIDDHQLQIAEMLRSRNLAVVRDVGEIDDQSLQAEMNASVEPGHAVPDFGFD